MEGGRVLFDASSYMLIEASGDSEAEYFSTTVEVELDAAAMDDDAQSCCCGRLSDSVAVHKVDVSEEDFYGSDFDDCIEDNGDDEGGFATEVEDGVVDQCCGDGKAQEMAAAEDLNKLKACEDSNVKFMNEGETDRVFWEACLAS